MKLSTILNICYSVVFGLVYVGKVPREFQESIPSLFAVGLVIVVVAAWKISAYQLNDLLPKDSEVEA